MKSLFPYQGKITKPQLEFFAAVCIASAIDHLESSIPGRWFGEPEDKDRWQKAQNEEMRPKDQVPQLISDTLEILGWNLSILFAQVTNDSMDTNEALELSALGDKLQTWADKWLNGEIGIRRTTLGRGHTDIPNVDDLARAWATKAWELILGVRESV